MAEFATPSKAGAEWRRQLLDRRARLAAIPALRDREDVRHLLQEVDSALARLDGGSFGACERCHDPIERRRLLGDPLTRVCLGCLSQSQQRALEHDLEWAAVVQRGLLPDEQVSGDGWEIAYRYRPLGPVSGDYCDVLRAEGPRAPTHFILGDVSGKGVAASILMAHLQAVFRSLVSLDLPLAELAQRANRIFCEGVVANAFSTLLLGRLSSDGGLELCNAGHCPPLLVRRGEVTPLAATGMPLGMFTGSTFEVGRFRLVQGDSLLLYTDGVSETDNPAGEPFGTSRLEAFARQLNGDPVGAVLEHCLDDLDRFRGTAALKDDVTLMLVRRSA